MKKLLALILTALMLISLVGCDNSSNVGDDNDVTNEGQGNTNNGSNDNTNNQQQNPSTDQKNKIDVSKITSSTMFSEGKAWVRYGKMTSEEYNTLYCINNRGEILFTITNTFLNSPSPFYNGLSIVPLMINDEAVYCLCDEKGNITKPSDVGATEFLLNTSGVGEIYEKTFEDGYIFAKKTEATFSGSSVTAAILNSSLEIIAGYTEEIFTLYEEYAGHSYYNGYLYNVAEYKVFDVKTGKEIDDVSAFISSFEPIYASDMWEYDWQSFVYYDILASTHTVMLDLSEYSETISRMYLFENGRAPLVFESAGKAFFTVIKEDGSFCFEPVELSGHSGCNVKTYNGKYLVVSEGNEFVIETFDESGKIAEIKMKIEGLLPTVHFCDDVIHITSTTINCYYSLNCEPLF